MTTFAFVDVEIATVNQSTSYINQQTLYTVPTGKLAKIKFDSVHVSKTSDEAYQDHAFIMYSQGTNIVRKHIVGYAVNTGTQARTISYYNPSDWSVQPTASGPTGGVYQQHSMSTQPQQWVNTDGTIDSTLIPDLQGYPQYSNQFTYGARVYCPETFFMKAGEVLKYSDALSGPTGNYRYTNMRLAVWLEDV